MQMYTHKVLQVGLGAVALAAVLMAGIAAGDAHAAGVSWTGQPSTGTFRGFNYVGVNSARPGTAAQQGTAAAPAGAPAAPAGPTSVQPASNGGGWSRAGHGGLPGMGN